MADSNSDLFAALAEALAAEIIGSYTDEDWQDSPEVEQLKRVTRLLKAQGREVPHVVLEAIEKGTCRGTA